MKEAILRNLNIVDFFRTEHFGKSEIWSEPHSVIDTSFGDEMPYG